MQYEPKNFDSLLGTAGFSDTLLKNHFTLYQGYVKNTNTLITSLAKLTEEGKLAIPEYAEMKRRFGWEFNGMRLHELYFGNMNKSATGPDNTSPVASAIAKSFGSHETWEKDFKGTGAMRGIGWAILYHDKLSGQLFNAWVNEHDFGHLAGATPLLILDVFEHAYMLDYGLKRPDYIEAFFKSIDWAVVEGRMKG